MSVLELQAVVGGYGESQILKGVSLKVDRGEIVVVVGPNGAGKSTSLKAVFGLLKLTSGKILLNDDDITNLAPEKCVRRGISFVPQTENIFPNLTVNENLEMGAYVRRDDYRVRLRQIYEMFPPLVEKRNVAAGTLSGGQRQMVAMGKALMVEPKILLLDEPTAGLSPKFRGEIFEIIQRINASGTPILLVEQNAKAALAVASRGYVLVDGKNHFEGRGTDLFDNHEVAEMFLGAGKHSPEAGRPGTAAQDV